VNCKYFIKPSGVLDNKYGTCLKYPRTEDNSSDYLVTGIKNEKQYWYCSTARKHDTMCGPDGKNYTLAKKKNSL